MGLEGVLPWTRKSPRAEAPSDDHEDVTLSRIYQKEEIKQQNFARAVLSGGCLVGGWVVMNYARFIVVQ